jgi:hypothetical protein
MTAILPELTDRRYILLSVCNTTTYVITDGIIVCWHMICIIYVEIVIINTGFYDAK